MKRARLLYQSLKQAEAETAFATPAGMITSAVRQRRCSHNWEFDGQTLTANRWTCSRCGKSEFRG